MDSNHRPAVSVRTVATLPLSYFPVVTVLYRRSTALSYALTFQAASGAAPVDWSTNQRHWFDFNMVDVLGV